MSTSPFNQYYYPVVISSIPKTCFDIIYNPSQLKLYVHPNLVSEQNTPKQFICNVFLADYYAVPYIHCIEEIEVKDRLDYRTMLLENNNDYCQ